MDDPESDERIAALREEIRRAGRRTMELRAKWLCRGAASFLALELLMWVLAALIPGLGPLALLGLTAAPVGILAVLCAFPGAILWRAGEREALARRLVQTPEAERGAVLLPLRSEESRDTRAIAEALILQLGVPTEPSPDDSPTGRGDETSAD